MITNINIDGGKAFDWGRASEDYAKYRDIYPKEFYQKIIDMGLCVKGQRVLDLGTGTGVLPRNLYRFGASFTGVDISENQISKAKELSQQDGMNIEYFVSSAEGIDFPDGSFDVVTACQCFIYFDKAVVMPKIHEALNPNGQFCVLSLIWLPFENEIAAASEKLVLKYNPDWTGGGFTRDGQIDSEWAKPLFKLNREEVFDIRIPFTRETWHGRIKACRGIGASSLSDEAISEFEREHIQILTEKPEKFEVLHLARILDFQKQNA